MQSKSICNETEQEFLNTGLNTVYLCQLIELDYVAGELDRNKDGTK